MYIEHADRLLRRSIPVVETKPTVRNLLPIAPIITGKDLSEAFRHKVLSMLKKEGKITDTVIENMMSWHHCGFQVHIDERI